MKTSPWLAAAMVGGALAPLSPALGAGSPPAKSVKPAPAPSVSSAPASVAAEPAPASPPAAAGAIDTRWAVGLAAGASTDYLDFGLGLRGGKTLDLGLYLGGAFFYHFAGGGPFAVSAPTTAPGYSLSASVYYVGPEAGWDFAFGPVVVRPLVGFGPAFFSSSLKGSGVDQSSSYTQLVFWPGADVLWSVPSSIFFVGGDVRFVSVPGGPAVGVFGTGGVHFGG